VKGCEEVGNELEDDSGSGALKWRGDW